MGLGKTYSTSYLADSNNNTGVDGQVLISTSTGINWTDIGSIPTSGGTQFFNQSSQYDNSTPGVAGYGNVSMDTSVSYYDTGKTASLETRGIVWTGKHYIITDHSADTAKFYDNNFDLITNPEASSITLPDASNGASTPHGAAWDGRYLYCINYTPMTIVAYDLDNGTSTATIVSETNISTYSTTTYGIEYAQGHLYTCADGKVSKFKVEGKTITHVFTSGVILATIDAQAVTYDGSYLWFTQNGQNAYKVSLDCTLVATITTGLPVNNIGWAWNGQNIASINHQNGDIYIVNTAQTRFDTEEFLVMGGNMGIGTTVLNSKLNVGDYMSSNKLTIGGWYGSGGGTLAFRTGYVPNAAYVWDTATIVATDDGNFNGRLEFSTSTSSRNAPTFKMVLKATGNLGIGVTNPHGKLSFANSVETRKIVLYETGNNDFQFYGFGIESNTLLYTTGADTDDHVFFSGASATTRNELMRIKGDGYVGIGTDSPASLLHVQGDAGDNQAAAIIENTYSGGGVYFPAFKAVHTHANHSYGTVGEFRAESGGATDRPSILFSNGHSENNWSVGQGVYGANDNFAIGSRTAHPDTTPGWATPRLMIQHTNGWVGINNTAPACQVHIGGGQSYGSLRISPSTANGESAMAFFTDVAGTATASAWVIGHAGWGNTLDFVIGCQNAGGPVITAQPDGNVGINTTGPNQKLHVNGGTQLGDINATVNFGTVALKVVEGTVSTGPTLGSGVVGAQAVLYSNGLFGMYTGVSSNGDTWMQSQRNDASTSTYDILLNPAGGRVAIGHNDPVGKLDVYRPDTNYAVNLSDTLNRAGLVVKSSGNYDSKITFSSGGSSRQYIQALNNAATTGRDISINPYGGNVGIKSTAPSYALDVTGTIRATGDVIAYSDARVKDNVITIDNALDKVTKLRGVSYTRNDVEDKTTKVGVIAQEVLEVLPEVVQQDDDGKYSVAYGNMVGLLIESIKELKAEIDLLKSKPCTCNKCNCNI